MTSSRGATAATESLLFVLVSRFSQVQIVKLVPAVSMGLSVLGVLLLAHML